MLLCDKSIIWIHHKGSICKLYFPLKVVEIFLVLCMRSNLGCFEYYAINLICSRSQVLTYSLCWVSSTHSQLKGESRTSYANSREFSPVLYDCAHTLQCPEDPFLVLGLETWGFSLPTLSHISPAASTLRMKQ